MRSGRSNTLHRIEKHSLERPRKEVEIHRNALKQRKKLAFSKDTCLEKKIVQSKVIPRKVEVESKPWRKLNKRRLGWRLAWWESSIKRAADGKRQRNTKIIDEKRNKYMAKNGSLRNTLMHLKGATFVILKNHASAPIRKERAKLGGRPAEIRL